ncbi:CPBP family intramembrane metalloprotease [bacterium]|nr:CPBP family intramembrane metalloprotease [bacterium]
MNIKKNRYSAPGADPAGGGLRRLLADLDPRSAVILLIVPIVLTVWVYYGKKGNCAAVFPAFGPGSNADVYATIYEYMAAFFLMFLIPFMVVRTAFRTGLRELGLRTGDLRYGLRFLAVAAPLFLLSAYLGSADPAMQAEYPLAGSSMTHAPLFLAVELFYLIYYFSWEFLFRGLMLFGLEKRFGAAAAILIQTIPSAIVHIGKPASESFAAIFAGLLFGFLAVRTRSFLYPLILHAVIGIGTDLFITLRMG